MRALIAGAALLVAALAVAGCSPLASKGTMPPPGPNGDVDASLAPDFIAVAGPDEQGPSSAPASGEPTSLTIYVRSAVRETAWFAVLAAGDLVGGQGYNGIGVGCVDIEAGGQLVLLDRRPQDDGVQTLRTIYSRGQVGSLPTLWVDIGAGGAISQGQGIPVWWTSEPQGC